MMSALDNTLEKQITDELQKTGFPTEIMSASVMHERGWNVLHNPSYLDDIEACSREFDIRAYHQWSFPTRDRDFCVGVYLITECKKSEKPWVFFTSPEPRPSHGYSDVIKGRAGSRHIFADNSGQPPDISVETLEGFHHYFLQSHLGRTFCEPFKGQDRSDSSPMIFGAVMSCVKATLFRHQVRPIDRWLRIYYPLIIFAGNLFEARVESNRDVMLSPTSHIQLSFSYSSVLETRSHRCGTATTGSSLM